MGGDRIESGSVQSERPSPFDGDWASAARVALATLLATAVGVQLLLLSAYLLTGHGGASHALAGGNGVGNYLRAISAGIALSFFAGIHGSLDSGFGLLSQGGLQAAPLGATALGVGTAAFMLRRVAVGDRNQRIGLAVRSSVLVAVAVVALSFAARFHPRVGRDLTIKADPVAAGIGAIVLMLVVGLLAAGVVNAPWRDRARAWEPAVRPAARAVTLALVLGWVAVVVSAMFETRGTDASVVDVLKAIPGALAFGPNVGQVGGHVGMLGSVGAGVGGLFGTSADISLLERHGLSAYYWFYVLIPFVVAASVARGIVMPRAALATEAADETEEAPYSSPLDFDQRAAQLIGLRVVVVFGVLWAVLAVLARVRFTAAIYGSSAGIKTWQALVLPIIVLGAITWFLAGALARRQEPAPRRGIGFSLSPASLTLLLLVVIVALAGCTVAAAKKSHGSHLQDVVSTDGSALSVVDGGSFAAGSDSDSQAIEVPSVPIQNLDQEVQDTLQQYADSEESYRGANGAYTDNEGALGVLGPPGITVTIYTADTDSFCIVGEADGGPTYTYDSHDGTSLPGSNC